MIECIDNLQGTNQYRQELKMHLNRALQECEKISNEIYVGFAKADKQELPNLKEGEVPMLDIYNTISKAYDYAFDFFTTTPANEMPILMDILSKARKFQVPKSKVHKIIDNYLYQRKNEQKQTKNDNL